MKIHRQFISKLTIIELKTIIFVFVMKVYNEIKFLVKMSLEFNQPS